MLQDGFTLMPGLNGGSMDDIHHYAHLHTKKDTFLQMNVWFTSLLNTLKNQNFLHFKDLILLFFI